MKRFCLVLAAIVVFSGVRSVQAQNGWPYLSGPYGAYPGWYAGLYPRERLPHFALFPPVYYSLPVPRSYGYSPFAYPPGYPTPEIEYTAAPATIINPYVPQEPAAPSGTPSAPTKKTRLTAAPLRIINPYVESDQRSAISDQQAAK